MNAPAPPKRMAVIGGGMGGVATAWLCDREWEVSLFEAKDKLGGNCDSERVDDPSGKGVVVDLGAQFFHPETHPTYVALLDLLERRRVHGHDRGSRRVERHAHLCVLPLDGGAPHFSSTRLMRTPLFALDFAVYSRAARKMAFRGGYDVTVAQWVEGLSVSRGFKDRILLPWLTASEGHPLEETKRSSARAILQLFAPSHPKHPLERATTWTSEGGFQGTIMALADQCKNTSVRTGAPVIDLEKVDRGWFVHSANARSGPFDAVVINAPPWESKKLLGRLPWAEELISVLDGYESLSHRLTIHSDPTYMHGDRRNWGLANVGVEPGFRKAGARGADERSELSIWLGAGLGRVEGKSLELFKSWTTYRDQSPKRVLFERSFRHSVKTPAMMAASRRLRSWQGKEGLWFAGQFTSGIDLQESALRSAMAVGESLCPSSPNLAALANHATVRGRSSLDPLVPAG